jgi:hypothetical protein
MSIDEEAEEVDLVAVSGFARSLSAIPFSDLIRGGVPGGPGLGDPSQPG